MKIPDLVVSALGALAFLLGGPAAKAQTVGTPDFDPLGEFTDADLPKQLRVMVEFIEMPQEALTELLAEPRTGANDTDLRAQVATMLKEKKAVMLDTAVVTTRSGQRSKIESISEHIYPTEYELAGPKPKAGAEAKSEAVSSFPVIPGHPTAFEMRPVGTTLEVDPVLGADGVRVELNLAPEIVYDCGRFSFGKWKTKDAEVEVTQPHFYSIKMQSAITVLAGQTHLAAVLTPKNEEGEADPSRKVLLFVRADVLVIGK